MEEEHSSYVRARLLLALKASRDPAATFGCVAIAASQKRLRMDEDDDR